MTKMYEALQAANQDRTAAPGKQVRGRAPSMKPVSKSLEQKFFSLHQRIETMILDKACRIVEIVGAQAGEEALVLGWEFAKLVASRLDRRVLVVAGGHVPMIEQVMPAQAQKGWEKVLRDEGDLASVIFPVGDTNISVTQMSASDSSLAVVLASAKLPALLNNLRDSFDMVLIFMPPHGVGANATLVSALADGVVIVLESCKTRYQVVQDQIEQIRSQGGNVLGVILNNQRHYIPRFIYRRML